MDWFDGIFNSADGGPWYSLTARAEAPLLIAIASLVVTGVVSVIAFSIARRIERRRIVLDFLRELNSTEMMRDRHNTVQAIRRFSDPVTGRQAFKREIRGFLIDSSHFLWSPGCDESHFGFKDKPVPLRSKEAAGKSEGDFISNHGLANFIYFIARVQICRDKNLLDKKLADAFLYSWFLHYYAFLARFVAEVEDQLERTAPIHRRLEPGWIGGLKAAVAQMEYLMDHDSLGPNFGRQGRAQDDTRRSKEHGGGGRSLPQDVISKVFPAPNVEAQATGTPSRRRSSKSQKKGKRQH